MARTNKTYKDYITKRASKSRGKPSNLWAITHPFPTYNAFGTPEFVDQSMRQYKRADGFDAFDFERDYSHVTNPLWNPEDISYSIPGAKQFLYMRIKRENRSEPKVFFPVSNQSLTLIHLRSSRVYSAVVETINGGSHQGAATGSVIIKHISKLGILVGDDARKIKKKLPQKYKKLVKINK